MPTKTPIPPRPGMHDKEILNKAMGQKAMVQQKAAINSKPLAKVKTSAQKKG